MIILPISVWEINILWISKYWNRFWNVLREKHCYASSFTRKYPMKKSQFEKSLTILTFSSKRGRFMLRRVIGWLLHGMFACKRTSIAVFFTLEAQVYISKSISVFRNSQNVDFSDRNRQNVDFWDRNRQNYQFLVIFTKLISISCYFWPLCVATIPGSIVMSKD